MEKYSALIVQRNGRIFKANQKMLLMVIVSFTFMTMIRSRFAIQRDSKSVRFIHINITLIKFMIKTVIVICKQDVRTMDMEVKASYLLKEDMKFQLKKICIILLAEIISHFQFQISRCLDQNLKIELYYMVSPDV